MIGKYTALLLTFLLPGLFASAQITITPMQADPENGGLLSNWQADAPFAPQAGFVHEGVLHIGRLDAAKLRFASTSIGPEGIAAPAEEAGTTETTWTITEINRAPFAGAESLYGSEGRWIVGAAGAERFYLLDAGNERSQAADPPAYEYPFETIEGVAIEGGVIRFLGRNQDNTWIAGKTLASLGQTPEWLSGPPIPDARAGAAFLSAPQYVLAAGGHLEVNGTTVEFDTVFRSDVDENGKPSTWGMVARGLPAKMREARGAEVNGLFAVMPRHAAATDAATSQTLTFATTRPFGAISGWREIPIGIPATNDPVLIPFESVHQLIVADANTAPAVLRGFGLPPTADVSAGKRSETYRESVREKGLLLADFQAALVRARDQDRYHVVFVFDESPESAAFRDRLNLNRSLRVMLEECVLSEPSPADRDAVLQRIGATKAPAIGLLSPEGQPLGVTESLPDNKGMHDLLQPMWAPRL
ncbi:MAG: hypothetical protein PWP23_442 [Candidatus Sumerlaeota bacterium]|nr:hypothetical protein [Candidatus Sumerlaeota bacterium]